MLRAKEREKMSRQYRGGHASTSDQADAPVDLENQFIMRFPPEAAAALKEALQTGGGNLVTFFSTHTNNASKDASNRY